MVYHHTLALSQQVGQGLGHERRGQDGVWREIPVVRQEVGVSLHPHGPPVGPIQSSEPLLLEDTQDLWTPNGAGCPRGWGGTPSHGNTCAPDGRMDGVVAGASVRVKPTEVRGRGPRGGGRRRRGVTQGPQDRTLSLWCE